MREKCLIGAMPRVETYKVYERMDKILHDINFDYTQWCYNFSRNQGGLGSIILGLLCVWIGWQGGTVPWKPSYLS